MVHQCTRNIVISSFLVKWGYHIWLKYKSFKLSPPNENGAELISMIVPALLAPTSLRDKHSKAREAIPSIVQYVTATSND